MVRQAVLTRFLGCGETHNTVRLDAHARTVGRRAHPRARRTRPPRADAGFALDDQGFVGGAPSELAARPGAIQPALAGLSGPGGEGEPRRGTGRGGTGRT